MEILIPIISVIATGVMSYFVSSMTAAATVRSRMDKQETAFEYKTDEHDRRLDNLEHQKTEENMARLESTLEHHITQSRESRETVLTQLRELRDDVKQINARFGSLPLPRIPNTN